MIDPVSNWEPKRFVRYERTIGSSMSAALVVTDVGRAYIKAMGNSRGPHPLACEWVGTQLANWFGLPTLDFAIMSLTKDDEIPLSDGRCAAPGPAFVTRAVANATTWSGSADDLDKVENTDMITGLVVFDTWTLNQDRHPPEGENWHPNYDNLLLSGELAHKGFWRMLPIDYTECFSIRGDLNEHVDDIHRIRNKKAFGVFDAFQGYLALDHLEKAVARLREIEETTVDGYVNTIPTEWQVTQGARNALKNLVLRRAAYLADNARNIIYPHFAHLF